jgi:hypothetical protein
LSNSFCVIWREADDVLLFVNLSNSFCVIWREADDAAMVFVLIMLLEGWEFVEETGMEKII